MMDRSQRNAILRKAKIKTQIMLGIVGSVSLDKILSQIKHEVNMPSGVTSKQFINLVFVSTLSDCIFGKSYKLDDSLINCYPVMIQALYNTHKSSVIYAWLNEIDRAFNIQYRELLNELRGQ
jgi:hypothetical protein